MTREKSQKQMWRERKQRMSKTDRWWVKRREKKKSRNESIHLIDLSSSLFLLSSKTTFFFFFLTLGQFSNFCAIGGRGQGRAYQHCQVWHNSSVDFNQNRISADPHAPHYIQQYKNQAPLSRLSINTTPLQFQQWKCDIAATVCAFTLHHTNWSVDLLHNNNNNNKAKSKWNI